MIDHDALGAVGYTTVELLDPETLRDLQDLHGTLSVDPTLSYWASSVHADRPTARRVDQAMKARLRPALDRLLPGHEPFLAAFIDKGARGGTVGLHPDWTYTDERHHRARLIWCPLVDADAANGTLRVVPASHRVVKGLRGSGAFPSTVAAVEDDLLARHAVTVPLAAGEAVVYDAALIHGSGTNETATPRPAAAVALAPTGAPLVHFHRPPDGPLQGFTIDEAWYTTQPYGEAPSGYPALEPWDTAAAPIHPGDLVAATGAT